MYTTSDIYVSTGDGRHFEWTLFISAKDYTEAVKLIEQKVRERWPAGGCVVELNLQAIQPDDWTIERTKDFGDTATVYGESHPKEMVRNDPVLKKWWQRIFS